MNEQCKKWIQVLYYPKHYGVNVYLDHKGSFQQPVSPRGIAIQVPKHEYDACNTWEERQELAGRYVETS